MSVIWFNIFILIINFFRKRDKFISNFNVYSILFLILLAIIRVIFSFDFKNAIIINSEKIYPIFYNFITYEFSLNSLNLRMYNIIILIWVVGILILTICDILNFIKFKKILNTYKNIWNKNNETVLGEIIKSQNIGKKINIVQTENINSPMIVGINNPTIYLPNINFTNEELHFIIFHELNHFLGKDIIKKIFMQIFKNIFWWNPFIHIFAKDFDNILEVQCDLRTTKHMTNLEKKDYLKSIAKVLRNDVNKFETYKVEVASYLINTSNFYDIKQRFKIVLNCNYKSKSKYINIFICILFFILFIASYFFIFKPFYFPEDEGIYYKEGYDTFLIENDEIF